MRAAIVIEKACTLALAIIDPTSPGMMRITAVFCNAAMTAFAERIEMVLIDNVRIPGTIPRSAPK